MWRAQKLVMSSPGPPATVFEAIKAYLLEVRSPPMVIGVTLIPLPLPQAPAYHIALEAILVSWITYLLFFSKQYRPASKHDKLSKEVCAQATINDLACSNQLGV